MSIRRHMDMQVGAFTMSLASNVATEPSQGLRHLDPDTDFKVRRITSYINEAIHMAANEPSLGLYRIQEHIHRTAPQLATKKKDLKANNKRIVETSYDLNLSVDVVDSMHTISNFTRVHEALKTTIDTKRKLNIQEDQEKARRELDQKNAKIANRSISCNEPAEGYICPICYFALSAQEELIEHWQEHHNLEDCENDTFHEVEMPMDENNISGLTIEDDNDMTVIHTPKNQMDRVISEGEDVVRGFLDSGCNFFERSETSASDASSNGNEDDYEIEEDHYEIEGANASEVTSTETIIVHNPNEIQNVCDSLSEDTSKSPNHKANIISDSSHHVSETSVTSDNICDSLHDNILEISSQISHETENEISINACDDITIKHSETGIAECLQNVPFDTSRSNRNEGDDPNERITDDMENKDGDTNIDTSSCVVTDTNQVDISEENENDKIYNNDSLTVDADSTMQNFPVESNESKSNDLDKVDSSLEGNVGESLSEPVSEIFEQRSCSGEDEHESFVIQPGNSDTPVTQ